jgi:hypothetical protein
VSVAERRERANFTQFYIFLRVCEEKLCFVEYSTISEMRAGPSQSEDRLWLQTGSSCGGQEPLVVNVELKRRGIDRVR